MTMPASRRLVLVRHAKSAYPAGVADHDRPLNERGRRDAPAIGRWLAGHLDLAGVRPPLVLVSSAVRAQQTWALASAELGGAWSTGAVRDEPRIYEAWVDTLLDVASGTPDEVDVLVMVGHNPGVATLVEALCAPAHLVEEATAAFPTSAIAVIDGIGDWAALSARSADLVLAEFAVPRG